MGFFDFLRGKTKIKGSIGYFGLADWWLSAFSDEERRYIQNKFQPLGSSGDSLTSGEITYTSETAIGLLSGLAGWFSGADDRPIAHKILEKAEDLSHSGAQILDVYFLYHEMIGIYYKDRENPECMEKAVYACRQQIGLAPKAATAFKSTYKKSPLPSHTGYEQLAIILEREGRYTEVVELCEQAAKQGWAGNWRQRIERCEKKLEKSLSTTAPAPSKPRKRKARNSLDLASSEIDRAQILVNECLQKITVYDDNQPPEAILPIFDLCISNLNVLVRYEDAGQFTAEPSAKEMLAEMERGKDSVCFSVVKNTISDFWKCIVPEDRPALINRFQGLLSQLQEIKKHVKNPRDIERVEAAVSLGIKKLSLCPDAHELLLYRKNIMNNFN